LSVGLRDCVLILIYFADHKAMEIVFIEDIFELNLSLEE
jgi:hypothetical protein